MGTTRLHTARDGMSVFPPVWMRVDTYGAECLAQLHCNQHSNSHRCLRRGHRSLHHTTRQTAEKLLTNYCAACQTAETLLTSYCASHAIQALPSLTLKPQLLRQLLLSPSTWCNKLTVISLTHLLVTAIQMEQSSAVAHHRLMQVQSSCNLRMTQKRTDYSFQVPVQSNQRLLDLCSA